MGNFLDKIKEYLEEYFIKDSDLADVAISGDYDDLINKPNVQLNEDGKKITVKVDEDIISSNVEVLIGAFKESYGSESIINASPLGFFSLGSLVHGDGFYIPTNFARTQSVNSKNFFVIDFNIPSDIDYVPLNIYTDVLFSVMKDTSYTLFTYPMPVISDSSSYSPDQTEYIFGDEEENEPMPSGSSPGPL